MPTTWPRSIPALALFEPATQRVDHLIGSAPAPILSGDRGTGRREREAMPVDRARLGEGGALTRQPIDRATGILGNRGGERGIGLAVGLPVDRGDQLIPTELHVVIGDMKNASGPARAAQIIVVGAGLQHGGAQAQLCAAQRRAQPGETAADRHQVEMQRLFHLRLPLSLRGGIADESNLAPTALHARRDCHAASGRLAMTSCSSRRRGAGIAANTLGDMTHA